MDIERAMTLVLTASIDPKGMPGVTRADPAVREADYLDNLRYYLTHHPRVRRIVFVENSGWDLSRLKEAADAVKHDRQIEFVSLSGNDYPRHLGKGYGELKLLDDALSQSELITRGSHVAKLTGRLRLVNLTRIVAAAPDRFDLLCDVRDHQLYRRLRLSATSQRCDSRFFVIDRSFYGKALRGRFAECGDSRGIYFENVLFTAVKQYESKAVIVKRFVTEPRYRGYAAHGGISYDSPRARLRWWLRWGVRKALPWWQV